MEEAFALCYGIPGVSFADVLDMTSAERDHLLKLLVKQKERESKRTKG